VQIYPPSNILHCQNHKIIKNAEKEMMITLLKECIKDKLVSATASWK